MKDTTIDPAMIAHAMQAENETRLASGMRITYIPGPVDRNAPGMTWRGGDQPDTYDGAWKCCDGVFCNTYPDVTWGQESVMKWITDHMRGMRATAR